LSWFNDKLHDFSYYYSKTLSAPTERMIFFSITVAVGYKTIKFSLCSVHSEDLNLNALAFVSRCRAVKINTLHTYILTYLLTAPFSPVPHCRPTLWTNITFGVVDAYYFFSVLTASTTYLYERVTKRFEKRRVPSFKCYVSLNSMEQKMMPDCATFLDRPYTVRYTHETSVFIGRVGWKILSHTVLYMNTDVLVCTFIMSRYTASLQISLRRTSPLT